MTLRYFNIAIIAVLMLAYSSLHAQSLLRGPYLQMPTDSSIVVKWRTSTADTGTVHISTTMGGADIMVTETSPTTEHEVLVTGLQPETKYYYYVTTGGNALAGGNSFHYFSTNPIPGTVKPVRIWAIGDFGKGNTEQYQVRNSYTDYTGARGTDVWIWLGDNAYDDGTDQEYQDKVFNIYDTIFRYTPFWPCPGNHDYNSVSPIQNTTPPLTHTGPYYDIITVPTAAEAGGFPTGHELFYSYDYGNVHMISLNSELGSGINQSHDWTGAYPFGSFNGSPMTDWLHNDLQQNDKPWVIVYFHQPPYSKGSHDSDDFYELYMKAMRENFVPIFNQYGVDMVINGHSHVYERSYPLLEYTGDSEDFDPNTMALTTVSGYDSLSEAYVKLQTGPNANKGTVYAVVGCSASKDSDPDLDHPAMFFGAGGDTTLGSFIIDIDSNRLDACFLRMDGKILDHFTILKMDSLVVDTTDTNTSIVNLPLEEQIDLDMFPNPFQRQLTLTYNMPQQQDLNIRLFSSNGKLIYQKDLSGVKPGKGTHTIKTAGTDLPVGVYLLEISSGDKTTVKKLMKL